MKLTTGKAIRACVAPEVKRLAEASASIDLLDQALIALGGGLRRRLSQLRADCLSPVQAGVIHLKNAEAQRAAELARRATLGEILKRSGRLKLIAAMAVSRWLKALSSLKARDLSEAEVKAHVDAGRIAHRCLVSLRPAYGLQSGAGQLTASVVVAGFLSEAQAPLIEAQLLSGLRRASQAMGSEEAALEAVRRALLSGEALLLKMVEEAKPVAADLMAQAAAIDGLDEARQAASWLDQA